MGVKRGWGRQAEANEHLSNSGGQNEGIWVPIAARKTHVRLQAVNLHLKGVIG